MHFIFLMIDLPVNALTNEDVASFLGRDVHILQDLLVMHLAKYTRCPKMYCKSILHLLKYAANLYYTADAVQI